MRDQQAMAAMLCPLCHVNLQMTDRQGVEIDYCPQCRGVWLDRGELDKIVDRSARNAGPAPAATMMPQQTYRPDRDASQYGADDGRRYQKNRKKSFLEELFD